MAVWRSSTVALSRSIPASTGRGASTVVSANGTSAAAAGPAAMARAAVDTNAASPYLCVRISNLQGASGADGRAVEAEAEGGGGEHRGRTRGSRVQVGDRYQWQPGAHRRPPAAAASGE